MLCPSCDCNTTVTDTRKYYDKELGFYYVERKRKCVNCGERFSSIEVNRDIWSTYVTLENQESAEE